jgi:hypothetical protein
MPPHPGGHLHWPSYGSQYPYCPQVKTGNKQLKHGGHFAVSYQVSTQMQAAVFNYGLPGGIKDDNDWSSVNKRLHDRAQLKTLADIS